MATPSDQAHLIRDFPNLAREEFEFIDLASSQYNCIAYAVGDISQPWSDDPGDYWPPEVARNPTVQGLENLFRWLGYQKCRSPRQEVGYQKVALYGSKGLWEHAALQMPNGRWRSKLGIGTLIEHETPRGLAGKTYGRPQVYMRRRI